MKKTVLASRFDLPFYFRLPSIGYFTWDPECDVALIHPQQRAGEVSFSKSCRFVNAKKLLDSTCPPVKGPSQYEYLLECETEDHDKISTLYINTRPTGGFSEFRAYTEITIFIVIEGNQDPFCHKSKARAFQILHHFINIYRVVTQDPFVYRIDEEYDTYMVDYSIGTVPRKYEDSSVTDILKNIQNIALQGEIGKGRELKLRLNTLEDLFPGKVMRGNDLKIFSKLIKKTYNIPLHYELIFTAQVELKRRNYHIAILEAETAFEVYIANTLLEISVALGSAKEQVLADMEKPRKLGSLSQRLRRLDSMVEDYQRLKYLKITPPFVESATYKEWKNHLYELRNRIVHEGWRLATFDLTKRSISACKSAIKEIEKQFPGIANPIQIYHGVDHLQKTAGRLKF